MPQRSKYNQKPIVPKLQVGILGVGAIGSVILSGLVRNENLNLHYFNRSQRKESRLQHHDSFYVFPMENSQTISKKNPLDWLIICLKEYHFEGAKGWFEKLIFPKTKIAIIRNGLYLKKPLLPYADSSQILECMINCPVQPDASGIYQQMGLAKIATPKIKSATAFKNLFHNDEFQFFQLEDFKTASWKKLIESASIGAITCLKNDTCRIFQTKEIQELYLNMIKEALEVARADGTIISENFSNELLKKVKNYPPEKGSSMLTDLRIGRQVELGAKNGVISKLGKKYGIATPLHDEVCLILKK